MSRFPLSNEPAINIAEVAPILQANVRTVWFAQQRFNERLEQVLGRLRGSQVSDNTKGDEPMSLMDVTVSLSDHQAKTAALIKELEELV